MSDFNLTINGSLCSFLPLAEKAVVTVFLARGILLPGLWCMRARVCMCVCVIPVVIGFDAYAFFPLWSRLLSEQKAYTRALLSNQRTNSHESIVRCVHTYSICVCTGQHQFAGELSERMDKWASECVVSVCMYVSAIFTLTPNLCIR